MTGPPSMASVSGGTVPHAMLLIGTSGWSYPSGKGTWNGLFYPATRSKRGGTKDFDELRFYAEHFDTVEVNSTFYGQPRPPVTRAWAERTPPGFEFSVKLYQKFTHPQMFKQTRSRDLAKKGSGVISSRPATSARRRP